MKSTYSARTGHSNSSSRKKSMNNQSINRRKGALVRLEKQLSNLHTYPDGLKMKPRIEKEIETLKSRIN